MPKRKLGAASAANAGASAVQDAAEAGPRSKKKGKAAEAPKDKAEATSGLWLM